MTPQAYRRPELRQRSGGGGDCAPAGTLAGGLRSEAFAEDLPDPGDCGRGGGRDAAGGRRRAATALPLIGLALSALPGLFGR